MPYLLGSGLQFSSPPLMSHMCAFFPGTHPVRFRHDPVAGTQSRPAESRVFDWIARKDVNGQFLGVLMIFSSYVSTNWMRLVHATSNLIRIRSICPVGIGARHAW